MRLELLAVPPEPGLALKITPQHYDELFSDVLEPNYTGLVLDTSPDITTPVTQFALERATQMVIVVEQGYVASGVVTNALPYLLERPAAGSDGSLATVVINKVMSDPRAGSVQTLREEIHNINEHLTIIEVPWDLDLRSQIDAGTYTLDTVRQRSTRVPLKELALAVMRDSSNAHDHREPSPRGRRHARRATDLDRRVRDRPSDELVDLSRPGGRGHAEYCHGDQEDHPAPADRAASRAARDAPEWTR
jgi:MinD-like ATPase involved in chromosome partitioning or flagellar assembly